MTTTKRCEVCGGSGTFVCAEGWWDEENKLMEFKTIDHRSGTINGSSQAYHEMRDYLDIKLLSYGKEREKEMWRKCREALVKRKRNTGMKGSASQLLDIENAQILSALDALDPDKSSPDDGREGEI